MKKRLVKAAPHIHDSDDIGFGSADHSGNGEKNTLLKLDSNEATIAPSPRVIESISGELLNRHPDIHARKLRLKLSNYTGASSRSIACFANSAAAFDAVTRTYLHPGLEALSCLPAALHFDISATVAGARVVYPKIKDIFEPGMAEIVSAITPRTRVIYLPNPNSVSGASFTEAEIVFLLAYAENTMVLVDESYFEFCNLTVIDLVRRFSNVIIFRTFSKAFALAGLGTSYIVTDPRNLTFINLPGYHKEPDVIAQAAAQTAIDDINYVMEYVRQVNESKKMLYENLTRLNYNFRITPANFLLLKTADPDELANMFRNNQILVNNLDNVPGFENYLRITIGTPSQTGILLDILAKSAGHRKPGDYSRKRAFAKV